MTITRIVRDEHGAVALIAGAAIATAVGIAAFSIDLSNAYSVQGRLQNAADAAALAAAQKLSQTNEKDWENQARAIALQLVEGNVNDGDGTVASESDVIFGQYEPASRQFRPNASPFNAVKVITRRTAAAGNAVPTYFAGIFGVDHLDVQTEAIAIKSPPATCLYAMDENASAALQVAGNAGIAAPNCALQINSTASEAAVTRGGGEVSAAAVNVVGDYGGGGFSPAPQTGMPAMGDPMAGLPEPAQPGPCFMTDFEINTSQVLPANKTYCGSASFSGNSKIELQPGVYYFKDADVQISSSSFAGEGVLIFLDANSKIHISGNGAHQISAAETGPYAGIVLFQSPNAPNPINMKSGNSTLLLSGAIYMPSSTFQVRGTGDVQARPGKVRSEPSGGQDKDQANGQDQSQGQGESTEKSEGGAQGEGAEQGPSEPEGEASGGGEPKPDGEEKAGKAPGSVHEIEYVIAYRFDLAGNANFRVGRQDAAAAARAALVY